MKNANCIKNIESKKENFPKEWRFFPLAKAIDFNPKRELEKGRHSKFISMADVQVFTKKISTFSVKKFSSGKKFKNGDTIMARITPCLENGKTSFIDFLGEGEIAAGSTEFIVLSGKKDVSDSNFVYYLSISPSIRSMAIKTMTGTSGRQRVDNEKFANLIIALPSIIEQKQIAEILSSLDEKIELNRRINSNLEKIASLLFKQWFIDFEFPNENGEPYKSSGGKMKNFESGEVPNNWIVGSLGDYFDIKYGKSDREVCKDAVYPVYGAGGFLGFSNSFDYRGPQTIIGCRGTCGNISVIFEDSKITHNSLIVSNEWGRFFLYLYLKNIDIENVITGSTQPQITIKDLSSLNVSLPSRRVVDIFSQIIDPLFLNIKANLLENIYLNKIRDSLLPRLMNGKIRVNKKYE